MKRIVLILTLAIAGAAFAQQGPPPAGGPPPPRQGGDQLAAYLNLTTEQKAAWEAARKEFETTAQPLFEKEREAHEALDAMLESKSTDACGIGTRMLAIRTIGDQIRAAHDAFNAKRQSVLTAEQKLKLEAFEAAAQMFRGREGAPPPPPPPGH
jgi:Spy/CpxP family protein refolding chaperone